MSLLKTLLQAVYSWRLRRGGAKKATKRADVALERLDHRQLLAVNFTGNVITDFPVATTPGVVVLTDQGNVTHPTFLPNTALQNQIQVSGFDINGLRLTYTQADDILSIGIQQPDNPKNPGHEVLAGDADNNGNSGVADPQAPPGVDPAVLAIQPQFKDFQNLGGSEYMGAFLDLKGTGTPDIVAGIGTGSVKLYEVARAVNTGSFRPDTTFGAPLPENTGRLYLNNDPNHPNMEFEIDNFSKLFLAETGTPLTNDSVINVGAYAGSQDDFATEATFPPQPVRVGDATIPTPVCPPPPPLTPPVVLNFHQFNHIDTAHAGVVRVQIFGTGNFDVNQIDPATVSVGGATSLSNFLRRVPGSPFPERTFIFRGTDLNLPPGITDVHVTGSLLDGTKFDSLTRVFNRDASFFPPGRVAARDARLTARGLAVPGAGTVAAAQEVAPAALKVDYGNSQPADVPPDTTVVTPPAAPAARVHAAHRTTARPAARPARNGTRVADLKQQGIGIHSGA